MILAVPIIIVALFFVYALAIHFGARKAEVANESNFGDAAFIGLLSFLLIWVSFFVAWYVLESSFVFAVWLISLLLTFPIIKSFYRTTWRKAFLPWLFSVIVLGIVLAVIMVFFVGGIGGL